MPRFFLPSENFKNIFVDNDGESFIRINGSDAFHMVNVQRIKTGEHVTVCDMAANEYLCSFESSKKENGETVALLKVISKSESAVEPKTQIHVFQAFCKNDKFDTVVQKCVELGASKITPVLTQRCISRPDESSVKKKIERLNKISYEASKQCGRGIVPAVTGQCFFEEALELMKGYDVAFICYEGETHSLKNILKKDFKSCAFLIGPEGGFSQSEIDFAKEAGIATVSLGKLILRTETAAMSVLSMLLYEKEL